MSNKMLVLSCVVMLCMSFAGCLSRSPIPVKPQVDENDICIDKTNNADQTGNIEKDRQLFKSIDDRIIDDNNTRFFSNIVEKVRTFDTLESLGKYSDFIFTGTCTSANPIFQNDTLYTLSQIKVDQVFKGDINSGDVVSIVEMGGRTTFGEYEKGCNIEPKAFEVGHERLPTDYNIVSGMEGFYPLKAGQNVLLFTGDSSGFLNDVKEPLYDIVGAFDGKLFKQEDGSYKRPKPSRTDTLEFGDNYLTCTSDELIKLLE